MKLNLTKDFKARVINSLLDQRKLYGGADIGFAKMWRIPPAVFSQIKNGTSPDGILADDKILDIGRKLGIKRNSKVWQIAVTDVVKMITMDVEFCKRHAKSRMCCDEAEIGKTTAAKYLSRTLPNCFYVDMSQVEGKKLEFVRLLATSIGLSANKGNTELLEDIKYYLNQLEEPIVIIDEAGDLETATMICLKGLWNGTEGSCAWYMIGADGLRSKLEKGIRLQKPGYKELASRFSMTFTRITPSGKENQQIFYSNLIQQVLQVNNAQEGHIKSITKKCLVQDGNGMWGGLRRAESLLLLEKEAAA